uniref:Uncharacterized protein n=1 Tax=Acrobeloides nanus TaxID=290746 RepID=A0A914DIV7_9BILA
LRRVEKFLELDDEITNDQLVFNENKGFYCFRRRGKKLARCLGNSKGRAHVPVSENTRTILAQNFAPFNKKFFALINQHFNW